MRTFLFLLMSWQPNCNTALKNSYFFRRMRTALAVLASRPVVGSSRKRTGGSVMSSIPMLVLFRSPPDTPRINSVPTCKQKKSDICNRPSQYMLWSCAFSHPAAIFIFRVPSMNCRASSRWVWLGVRDCVAVCWAWLSEVPGALWL